MWGWGHPLTSPISITCIIPDCGSTVVGLSSLMASSRPVLLLTGFGPFPRVPVNATSLLVPRIAEAADRAFAGVSIVCEIIPTEWRAGLTRVETLYAEHRPFIAIHFGVSGRASGFR